MVSSLYRRKTFQDLPSKVSQQAVKHPWPRRKVRPVGSTPRYFLVGQTPIFDVLPTYLVVSSHLQTGYETNICKKQVLSLLVKNQLNVFWVLLKFHHFFIHFFFIFSKLENCSFHRISSPTSSPANCRDDERGVDGHDPLGSAQWGNPSGILWQNGGTPIAGWFIS